jgi:hypothetical protein
MERIGIGIKPFTILTDSNPSISNKGQKTITIFFTFLFLTFVINVTMTTKEHNKNNVIARIIEITPTRFWFCFVSLFLPLIYRTHRAKHQYNLGNYSNPKVSTKAYANLCPSFLDILFCLPH